MEELQSYLAELYNELSFRGPKEKNVQILTLIMNIKREYPNVVNSKNSLYLDVKRFISAYLRSKRIKDYGYEDYDLNIIKGYIMESDFNDEQKVKLLIYTRYILSSLSYEYNWINKLIKVSNFKLAAKKHKLKCILLASSWNTWTLLLSVLLIFSIECIMLLPAPVEWMAVCTITSVKYTDYNFINHVLNVISLHFDCIDNSANIEFSSWGIIGLVLWNLLYIIVCVNFLFKNLFSKFDINDLD